MKFIKRLLLLSSVLLLFACNRKETTKTPDSSTKKPTTVITSKKTTSEKSTTKAKKMVSLTLSKNINEGGVVEGAGSYEEKTNVKIKATANANYEFKGWYKGEELISSLNEYEFNISENTEIVAKFELQKFRITVFQILDEGGTPLIDDDYEYGSTITLTAAEVAGHTFMGWYENGTDPLTNDVNIEITVEDELYLCAMYKTNSYTVSLEKNIDSCTVTGADTYLYNSEITITATPSEGYKFVSWNNGEEIVSTDSEYTFNVLDNITLTAIFEPLKYNVTFTSNMQDVGIFTGGGEYEYGSSVTVKVTPKNSGYVFDGWFKNHLPVSTDSEYTFTMPNQDVELLARFYYNKFNVSATQNIEEAGTITGTGTYYYRTTITVTTTLADGYNFIGWFDSNDKELSKNLSYVFQLQNNDVELVAKYELATYTITVNKNIEEAGTISGQTSYHHNDNVYLEEETNDGYTFIGWYNGENLISDDYECLFTMPANDLVLEARYDYETNMVRIHTNMEDAGTIPSSKEYKYLDTVTLTATVNTGYVFNGWYIGETKVCDELTYTFTMGKDLVELTVKYSYLYLTVTINQNYDNAGKITGSNPRYIRYNTTTDLIITPNTGYTFIGWYIGSTQISDELTYTYTVLEDVTITATFEIEEYTLAIQKNMDGGTVTGAGTYEYNSEVTVTVTLNPGYNFLKMKNEVTGDVITELTYTFTFTGETVITVTFEKIVYFAEAYVKSTSEGRGTVSGTIDEAYYNDEATFIATPTNEGYTFIGWYDNEDSLVSELATYTFNVTENVRLYAKFSINTYTLTLTMNIEGAATLSGAGTYEYSPTLVNASAIAQTKHGYVFIGWFENNELVSEDDAYYFKMPYRNVNLEARFEKDTYTVAINTYITAGGTVTGAGNYEYNSEVTVHADVETYYQFEGWYRGLSAFEELITTDPDYTFTITENTYISAKWTLIRYHLTTINSDEDCGYIYELTNYDCAANHEVEVLDASPKTGYEFVGWYEGDELLSTIPNYKFYPTKDLTLTAIWKLKDYNVVATASAYSEYATITGSGIVHLGDTFTLTITLSDETYSFGGWFINNLIAIGYTATLEYEFDSYCVNKVDENDNLNITAKVTSLYNTLTLVNSNEDGGTISGGGLYKVGTKHTITATPSWYYEFDGWYLDGERVSTSASYEVTMPDHDVTYTAKWLKISELNVNTNKDYYGEYSMHLNENTVEGEEITLTATPNSHCLFVGWYDGETLLSEETTYTFKMPDHDITYTAVFDCEDCLKPFIFEQTLNGIVLIDVEEGYEDITEVIIPSFVTGIDPDGFTCAPLLYFFYFEGTKQEWTQHSMEVPLQKMIEGAQAYYYSETRPSTHYEYWHYVNEKPVIWGVTIVYYLYGGVNDFLNPIEGNRYFDEDFELYPATKKYCEFVGWHRSSDFSSEIVTKISKDDYGRIELHAEFTTIESLKYFEFTTSGDEVIINSVKSEYAKSTELVVPDIVTKISKNAFRNCSNLVKLTIPFIGEKRVNPTDNFQYTLGYIFGEVLFEGTVATTQYYVETYMSESVAKTYYIPSSLKEVYVTDSTYLPEGSFAACTNIEKVVLANTFQTIGGAAFYGDTSLTDLILGDNITYFAWSPLYNCTGLVNISFGPSTLAALADNSENIQYCTNLENIYFTGTIADWVNNANFTAPSTSFMSKASNLYFLDENGEIEYNESNYSTINGELIIPEGVETIGIATLYNIGNNITSIIVPNSVTFIQPGAFAHFPLSESITLPFVGATRYSQTSDNQYPLGYIFGTTSNSTSLSINQKYIKTYNSTNPTYETTTYYIPATLKNVTITDTTYIQYGAFYYCYSLTSINLNCAIEGIAEKAFYSCEKIEEMIISDGLLSVNKYAFQYCENLKEVVIPNSVLEIGESIFVGCWDLEKLSIPFVGEKRYQTTDNNQYPFAYLFKDGTSGSVLLKQTYIENYSTNTTKTITTTIPTNLKELIITDSPYIQMGALTNLSNLEKIEITSSTTKISSGVLNGCSSLIELSIPFVGEKRYTANENTQKPLGHIFGETQYTNATLTEQKYRNNGTNTTINYYIPNDLISVTITDHYYLPYSAFRELSNLESIILPDDLEIVGQDAFYRCSSINTIILPDGVTQIGSYAFASCTSLVNIVLSESLYRINESAFLNCTSLTNVYYNNNLNNWLNIEFIDPLEDTWYANPMTKASNFYVIDEDGDEIFNDKNYSKPKNIEIDLSITEFNSYRFKNISSLENVYYGGSLEDWININFHNFDVNNPMAYAKNLYTLDENGEFEYNGNHYTLPREFVIPESIVSLTNQLKNLSSIKKLTIPSTVTSIKQGALHGLSSLETLIIPYLGNNRESTLPLGHIFGGSSYDNSTLIETRATDNGVTSLRNYYIPNNLKEITITLGNIYQNKVSINHNAFYKITSIEKITIIDSATLSVGTIIQSQAFYGCTGLKSFIVPAGVQGIDTDAFYRCYNLKEIYNLSRLNIQVGSTNYGYIAYYAVVVHNSISDESIYQNIYDDFGIYNGILFAYTGNQNSITIPDNVTKIAKYTFNECIELKEIIMQEGVAVIEEYAFNNCTNLTNISIPNSITTINDYAFYNCTSLEKNIYDNAYYLGNSENPYLVLYTTNSDIESLEINENCKIIYTNALVKANMTSVVIPNSVIYMGSSILNTKVRYLETPFLGTNRDDRTNANISFMYNSTTISLREVTITNALYIGKSALSSATLYKVTLPDTLISIGENAFSQCSRLYSIVIPSNVQSIGDNAFAGCQRLSIVVNLSDLPITKGQNTYGRVAYSALEVFTSLDDVKIIENDDHVFAYFDSKLYYLAYTGFNNSTLVLPDNLEIDVTIINTYEIYSYAFYSGSFESIIIPTSVTKIYSQAIVSCSNLTKIYYKGLESDWELIQIDNTTQLNNKTIYYYSETTPTTSGNYWHYDSNNNPVIWS